MVNGVDTMENRMRFLKKIKHWTNNLMIQQSHFPNLSKTIEIRISRRYLHSHVYCSSIHNSQNMKTTLMFFKGWMDKENVENT